MSKIAQIKYYHYRTQQAYVNRLLRDGHSLHGRTPRKQLFMFFDGYKSASEFGGKTACQLTIVDDKGKVVGHVHAYAYCSLSEKYNNKKGEKIALARAMALVNLD